MSIAAISLALALSQAEEPILLRGATVHTQTGAPIRGGEILIAEGRIVAVADRVRLPERCRIVSYTADVHITPGWIDAHSRVGMAYEGEEMSAAVTPYLRAVEGFESADPEIARARAAGVTLLALSPGDANIIAGGISLVRTAPGTLADMVVDAVIADKVNFAVSRWPRDRAPTSYAGMDMGQFTEILVKMQRTPRPIVVRAENLTEVGGAIETGRVVNVRVAVVGLPDPREMLDAIRDAGAGIILPLPRADWPEWRLRLPALLAERGIPFAFGTAESGVPAEDMRTSLLLAIANGLAPDAALAAVTDQAAQLLGIESRFGRLVEGAEGDVVVWSHSPERADAVVQAVILRGQVVHGELP